jgi:hypothetical protein
MKLSFFATSLAFLVMIFHPIAATSETTSGLRGMATTEVEEDTITTGGNPDGGFLPDHARNLAQCHSGTLPSAINGPCTSNGNCWSGLCVNPTGAECEGSCKIQDGKICTTLWHAAKRCGF